MTPKDKAIELYNTYIKYVTELNEYEYAKECALIAVDEIIDVLNGEDFSRNAILFWSSVKQEIEKL